MSEVAATSGVDAA